MDGIELAQRIINEHNCAIIFLTAFAFLNMIIGVVVNSFEQEHLEQNLDQGEPTLKELQSEIKELKTLLKNQNRVPLEQ